MKRILYLCILSGLLPLLASCTDGELFGWGDGDTNGELPVEFSCVLPDAPALRGVDNPKTSFSSGDMIHVQGNFVINIEGVESEVVRYGALRYNGKQWNAVEGSGLTWPNNAVSGEFHAYFVHESSGVLQPGQVMDPYLLSNLTSTTDPLEAFSASGISYGHAVRLKFNHICTHLTLTELEPMVANSYWFTLDSMFADRTLTLNNAYRLSLDENNQMSLEFCSVQDKNYYNHVYISASAVRIEEDGKVITNASFFLEPGNYSAFMLRYPTVAPNSYEYLRYDYDKIPENDKGGKLPVLEAGTPYVLNVTKSPGVTILTPPEAEGWDESDQYYDVDVEKFLRAVSDGDEYINDDNVKILEETATGTKLLHNVDFHYEEYSLFSDSNGFFEPNVNLGQIFDGGLHYIRNLGSPLFRYNYGTIRDLGIKNVKATFISDEKDDSGYDMSRQGSLCMWNQETGLIENVRISNVEIMAKVKTDEDQETHNIGCVLGSNVGTMRAVRLSGDFTLTVTGYADESYTDAVDATVIIGGIVGQNAGSGRIFDVTSLDGDLKITVYNNCQGTQGAFYVGGIVGGCSSHIDGIILPEVIIDGTESKGVASYMGCMAGELSAGANASLTSCVVSGTVRAGEVAPSGVITSVSYIGGIAGAVMNVPVADCRVAASVHGATIGVAGVTYATGGAFGRIRTAAAADMENIIAYGSALEGPAQYIGNFVGLLPEEERWESYAGRSIIVRNFGRSNVGASISSN